MVYAELTCTEAEITRTLFDSTSWRLGRFDQDQKSKWFLETSCIVCNPSIAYTHFAFEFFILQHLKVIVLTFCTFLENSHLPRPLVVYVRLKKVWGNLTIFGYKGGWETKLEKELLSLHSHHSSLWKTDAHKLQYGSCANMRWTQNFLDLVPDLEVDTVTNWKEQILHLIKATCMHWYCKNIATLTTCSWVKTVSNKNVKLYMRHANVFTTSFNSFHSTWKNVFCETKLLQVLTKVFGFAWRSSLGTSNNLFDHNTSWVFNSSIANDLKLQQPNTQKP